MNGKKKNISGRIGLCMALVVCVLAWTFTGCEQETLQVTSDQNAQPLPAGEESDAFLDRIASQSYVSENDTMRGLLMLINSQDNAQSFAERTRLLAEQNIVSRNWTFQADRPITKGKLAYMIYQACDMGGGVILTVTGPSQRYCMRELQFQEVMSQTGSFYSKISGMEFVAVLGRADVYKRTGKVPSQAGDTDEE